MLKTDFPVSEEIDQHVILVILIVLFCFACHWLFSERFFFDFSYYYIAYNEDLSEFITEKCGACECLIRMITIYYFKIAIFQAALLVDVLPIIIRGTW